MAIRFGVCGTAFWSEEVHLPGLLANEQVDVVGVFGRNEARVDALAGKFGVRPYHAFADMLKDVDAVSFVVPPAVQSRLAPDAARSGKHLLLEKPVTLDLGEAVRLFDAVRKAGVAASCFLTRLFVPEVRAFIDRARAVSPTEGRVSFRANTLVAGPYAASTWRKEEFGALWDVTPHGASVLASVLGRIEGVTATKLGEGRFDLSFDHADGGRSTFSLDLRAADTRLSESYRFDGTGGSADLPGLSYDRVATFAGASREMVETIVTDPARSYPAFEFAVHMVAVAAAAETSVRKRSTREKVGDTKP